MLLLMKWTWALRSAVVAACLLLSTQLLITFYEIPSSSFQNYRNVSLATVLQQETIGGPPRSRVGKVLMQYGNLSSIYTRGLATHDAHNERFGYQMFILRSKTLPSYWSKPAYVLKILLEELEKPEPERLQWLL